MTIQFIKYFSPIVPCFIYSHDFSIISILYFFIFFQQESIAVFLGK